MLPPKIVIIFYCKNNLIVMGLNIRLYSYGTFVKFSCSYKNNLNQMVSLTC